ncbi:MAG: AAA family ATPase [Clostridia bacterium]|nr:AAA family ATPase [Clostridia bacterium]
MKKYYYQTGLFLKEVTLQRDKIEDFDKYPFNIELIKNFESLKFNKNVTFLIGENGIGKSTFIEGLAVCCGLNAEGGTENFNFATKETHSILHEYLKTNYIPSTRTRFFLRAESFYNVATEVDNLGVSGYGENSLHNCSHGEAFLQLIKNRFTSNGLYILDEPESALSPSRQLTLLAIIDDLAKNNNCQFIIATHSPILISYRDGEILDLNDNFKVKKYEDTEIYKFYKMYLENYESMQHRLLD